MPGSANFHLKHIICPRQFNTQRDSRVSLTTPTSQNILQILAGFLLNQVFRANKAVCYYNTMHYAQMIICKKNACRRKEATRLCSILSDEKKYQCQLYTDTNQKVFLFSILFLNLNLMPKIKFSMVPCCFHLMHSRDICEKHCSANMWKIEKRTK